MATPLGFRKVKSFIDVPVSEETPENNMGITIVDNHTGSFMYNEVTNNTANPIMLEVNFNPNNMQPGGIIPIYPGTTRPIPMALYNFRADGVVTVVCYGQ